MKYVVFGAPLHVEATSEAEAVRIGERPQRAFQDTRVLRDS
jgi:hypothetical protein